MFKGERNTATNGKGAVERDGKGAVKGYRYAHVAEIAHNHLAISSHLAGSSLEKLFTPVLHGHTSRNDCVNVLLFDDKARQRPSSLEHAAGAGEALFLP